MAQLPFVDTHVHFNDLRDPRLRYSWLQPEFVHPLLVLRDEQMALLSGNAERIFRI